ncbi:hypothetical protein Efla_006800 [Eimeria flavescens]
MEGALLASAVRARADDERSKHSKISSSDGGPSSQRRGPPSEPEGPSQRQFSWSSSNRDSLFGSEDGQFSGSNSRSTSSSAPEGTVLSLHAPSSKTSSASSVDIETAPAFTLKWGTFLDQVLDQPAESSQRPAPRQPATIKQQQQLRKLTTWDLLLPKDTIEEAGGGSSSGIHRLGYTRASDPAQVAEASALLHYCLGPYTAEQLLELAKSFPALVSLVPSSRPPPVTSADVEEFSLCGVKDLERGEVFFSTGLVDPSQCRVYGPGLGERIAGVLSEFFIHAVTADGRYASHGGGRFVVYVEPVEDPHRGEAGSLLPALDRPRRPTEQGSEGGERKQFLGQVLDNEDGTCTVFFSCSVAVRHQVTILLDDKYPVAASPYIVSVLPGRVDASQTVAYGSSLQHFVRNGEMNDFVIQARDAYGNNIKRGGDKFCVEGLGAIKVVETHDFNDGLYRVKFFVSAGCENQYCQLSIRYDGQHIQGSPFYPKPIPEPEMTPPSKELPKTYGAMYLMNPSKSLLGAMSTFSSRLKPTPGTKMPTFPNFPSNSEKEEILRKLVDHCKPAKVRTRRSREKFMFIETLSFQHDPVSWAEDLGNMLACIKRHVSAGLLHAKIEKGCKAEFSRLTSTVQEIQKQLHTIYKSLQHRVVDSLPVTFELDDPEEVRKLHKERRGRLLQVHSQLEAKERELREREKKVKEQISSYMAKLSTDLKAREDALEMEQRALKINTQQVLTLTSRRLKTHVRREALIACEREPVEAKKSEFWQKEFQRMLIETPLVSAPPKAAAPKAPQSNAEVPVTEQTRHVETRPVDPDSVAFWLVEKQYIVPQRPRAGRHERVALDDRAAYRQTNLRRGNPSRVTFTEGLSGGR